MTDNELIERLERGIDTAGMPDIDCVDAAEEIMMIAATRLEALTAENKRLREYYDACEAVSKTGLFFATGAMLRREERARAALKGADYD